MPNASEPWLASRLRVARLTSTENDVEIPTGACSEFPHDTSQAPYVRKQFYGNRT